MPKKYYQDRKDRMDESRGMKRALRTDDYRRVDGESDTSGMIREDRSEIANLPQDVVYKEYPKMPMGGNYRLDDTVEGVDDNLKDSMRTMDRYQSDSMY